MRIAPLLLIIIFCAYVLAVPSLERRSALYRVDEYTDRYWNGHEWVYVLYPLQMGVAEAASTIPSDASDGFVTGQSVNGGPFTGTGADATEMVMRVGDDPRIGSVLPDGDIILTEYRSFIKFPISSLHGKSLASAVLKLTIERSIVNNTHDPSPPFNNPGLGNTLVIHINDYGTLDVSDFNSPSIGNDPGVLIPASVDPSNPVSVSVKNAMQDDINNLRSFTTYMVRTANGTDGDTRRDRWEFYTRNHSVANAPKIEYTLAPTNFTRDLKEQLKLSEHDQLKRGVASSRMANEPLSVLASHTRSLASSRALAELQQVVDVQGRSITASRVFIDSTLPTDSPARLTSRIAGVSEALSAVDLPQALNSFSRLVEEQQAASDLISRLAGYIIGVSESNIITDQQSRISSIMKGILDPLLASDAAATLRSIARSPVDTQAVSDSLSSIDAFTRLISSISTTSDAQSMGYAFTRLIDDATVPSDAISSIKDVAFALVEPIAIVDTLQHISGRVVILIDTISMDDVLSSSSAFHRLITTSLNVGDTTSRMAHLLLSIVEPLHAMDLQAGMVSISRLLSDSMNAADGVARELAKTASISDVMSASDALSRGIDVGRIVALGAGVLDAVGKALTLGVVEHISASELVQMSASYTSYIADAVGISDLFSAYRYLERALQDTIGAGDVFNYLRNLTISVITENVSVTDSIARINAITLMLTEPVVMLDSAGRVIEGMSRDAIESILVIDTVSNVTAFLREVGVLLAMETVKIMDAIGRSVGAGVQMEDYASASDGISSSIGFGRLLEEGIRVDDVLNRTIELMLYVVDGYSILNMLQSYTGYLVNLLDGVGVIASMVTSVVTNPAGTNTGVGAGVGAGGGGVTVLARSTFITVDASTVRDTLLLEGFLMDRDGVIPFSAVLSVSIVDASNPVASYRSSVEVTDGRYRLAIPVDEIFIALAPNSAEMDARITVAFNGHEHNIAGARYIYLPSSTDGTIRLERGIVFEAPTFNLVPSSVRYLGERLLIIYVENDGDDPIDALRITVSEGKPIKVKVSRNWSVTVQDDGIMLEGVDGHVLEQGERLMIIILKQGQFTYTVSAR
ncbi:MAG: hypothetical protein NZ517_01020 [Candidatus Nitrosocaldus sp.]|nr:hypothetical protein [Candidatus Nitrosocaldus sp.]